MSTFLAPASNINDTKHVMSAFKTIFEYKIADIAEAGSLPSSMTASLQIFDDTRKWMLFQTDIDVSPVLQEFQDRLAANPSATGPSIILKSFMVEGLRHFRVNHDCIWCLKMNVSQSNTVRITMHSIQALFYDVY